MRLRTAPSIEQEAILVAFDHALPQVYHYVLYRCRDRTLAEDSTSDTFLAAVRAVRDGHAESVSVSWLIGIARHKLADHWRRSARERRWLEAAYERPSEDFAEPLEPGRAMRVLDMINPLQRAALTLRHIDGLSVVAVAETLGRSVDATEKLLVRGRATFRRVYREEGEAGDD